MDFDQNFENRSFLWGVTHIAPQVEGENVFSDWYYASCEGSVPAIGKGNNYWRDYKEHHAYLEELGVTSFRLSIEWARIEPEEGVFDADALSHYLAILTDLKKRGIVPFVGLFHWTLPVWFARKYTLASFASVNLFTRFAEKICVELGAEIDYLIILNEPTVFEGTGYLLGERPPFRRNLFLSLRIYNNLIKMHNRVYTLWKKQRLETHIGSTHLWNDIQAREGQIFGRFFQYLSWYGRVGYVIARTKHRSDFLGINYYTSNTFYFGRKNGRWGFHGTNDWHAPDVWHHFSHGFLRVLLDAGKYNMPLFVLENGKPSHLGLDDVDRQVFLEAHVDQMKVAIDRGISLCGYFHYALMDSYEWDRGYDMKFGLIEVDRDTLALQKRNSFYTYQRVIRNRIV